VLIISLPTHSRESTVFGFLDFLVWHEGGELAVNEVLRQNIRSWTFHTDSSLRKGEKWEFDFEPYDIDWIMLSSILDSWPSPTITHDDVARLRERATRGKDPLSAKPPDSQKEILPGFNPNYFQNMDLYLSERDHTENAVAYNSQLLYPKKHQLDDFPIREKRGIGFMCQRPWLQCQARLF
jgi:hypothetical protein